MPESENVGLNLLRMTWNCHTVEKEIASLVGLSVHEVHCLTQLYVEKPCCVRKLVEILDLPSTSVSKLLRSLDTRGYITRSLDTNDRRVERVVLTEEGMRVIEKIVQSANNYADKILKELPSERATLLKGCIRLLSSKSDLSSNVSSRCTANEQ